MTFSLVNYNGLSYQDSQHQAPNLVPVAVAVPVPVPVSVAIPSPCIDADTDAAIDADIEPFTIHDPIEQHHEFWPDNYGQEVLFRITNDGIDAIFDELVASHFPDLDLSDTIMKRIFIETAEKKPATKEAFLATFSQEYLEYAANISATNSNKQTLTIFGKHGLGISNKENNTDNIQCNYVVLSDDERKNMGSSQHEQLIEQYQTGNDDNVPSNGIHIYSFSLYPDDYQPAGSENKSYFHNTTITMAPSYNPYRITEGLHSIKYST